MSIVADDEFFSVAESASVEDQRSIRNEQARSKQLQRGVEKVTLLEEEDDVHEISAVAVETNKGLDTTSFGGLTPKRPNLIDEDSMDPSHIPESEQGKILRSVELKIVETRKEPSVKQPSTGVRGAVANSQPLAIQEEKEREHHTGSPSEKELVIPFLNLSVLP